MVLLPLGFHLVSLDCPCPDEFLLGAFFGQQDRAGGMVSLLPAMDHDSVRRLADVEGHKKKSATQVSI
jgi:hypothetical protein